MASLVPGRGAHALLSIHGNIKAILLIPIRQPWLIEVSFLGDATGSKVNVNLALLFFRFCCDVMT
jgi:hypothetical protein